MLIHSKKIKEPSVPKYDIQAVKQPPCSLNRGVAPPQTKTNHKQDDSYRIGKIPVFINPHLHLLAEFSRFWDKYLGRIGRIQHKMPLKSHIHYITIYVFIISWYLECIIFLLFFFSWTHLLHIAIHHQLRFFLNLPYHIAQICHIKWHSSSWKKKWILNLNPFTKGHIAQQKSSQWRIVVYTYY